jgi:flagellar protein FliS
MYDSHRPDYLSARVLTADPLTLIGYLFEGLQHSTRAARAALHAGEILNRSRAITKAIEIIGELSASLNREAGNALSDDLARLYEYMVWRLTEANIQQSEAPLLEVEQLALSIGEAWKELGGAAAFDSHSVPYPASSEVHLSYLG